MCIWQTLSLTLIFGLNFHHFNLYSYIYSDIFWTAFVFRPIWMCLLLVFLQPKHLVLNLQQSFANGRLAGTLSLHLNSCCPGDAASLRSGRGLENPSLPSRKYVIISPFPCKVFLQMAFNFYMLKCMRLLYFIDFFFKKLFLKNTRL